jgi:hypothetical protein
MNETNEKPIGVLFQAACQSPEWKSAMIVYEKYKRKMNLELEDLVKLRDYIVDFSAKRELEGKKINKDILVQECSSEIKKWNK